MLYVKDPLCLKESLFISLEALSGQEHDYLREFVKSIPSTISCVNLNTSEELEYKLKSVIGDFKETKTYHWLREDFKNCLYDIEIQVNKKIS